MSIKSRFKSSSTLVHNGVWFDLPVTNSDGTQPRIRLRRSGKSNRHWGAAFREHSKDVNVDELSPEQDAEMMARTFVRACISDVADFQPDDDGNAISNDYDELCLVFADPEWLDLLEWCQEKSASLPNFQAKQEGEAKN